MADHQAAPLSFTLKVAIKCCATCPEKAKKKLLKLDGVDSILYDAKQGMMRVSGTVDPKILIQKFAKWGKKAQLLSPDSDSNPQKTEICFCSCSTSGPDDCSTVKKTQSLPAMDKQRSTKTTKKGFFGLFGKKNTVDDREPLLAITKKASKWRFPSTPMAGGACPRAPFFSQYGPPYPPAAYGRPMMGYEFGPYESVPPLRPPPPPFGFFNSRTPPVLNPMVHYTSYEDNHRYPYC